jgi:hypothetical protein
MSEPILAAMIGAGATIVTALFQIFTAFKPANSERRPPKSRFRSVMWTLALVFAAGVGGFAYAEYLSQHSRNETTSLRQELQLQMQALRESTARLEQLQLAGAASAQASSTVLVTLPPCRGPQVGFATQRGACTEQDAVQVTLCAPVPAGAQVTAIELFARADDAQTAWAAARLLPGQDGGAGRFADSPQERTDPDQGRLLCQSFAHWGETARTVRMLVRYAGGAARAPG